jgi:hypothetical protein
MSLKEQLMQALPALTDEDFSNHETDLYVKAKPGVYNWLKKNYQFANNVRFFIGEGDWEGQPALDIPFAHERT